MNFLLIRPIYLRLRWWLSKHNLIGALLMFNRHLAPLAVTRDTDVVIEGYPRSGNTFAEAAFRLAQKNRQWVIATHLHFPIQIKRAASLNKPCLVVIRHPMDAIASYLVYNNGDYPVRQALREYIDFHETVLRYHDHVCIARFDEVRTDFGAVMRKLNEKFGCSFEPFDHTQAHEKACFDLIRSRADAKYGKRTQHALRSAMPTPERTALKQRMQAKLNNGKYAEKVQHALDLYRKMERLSHEGMI